MRTIGKTLVVAFALVGVVATAQVLLGQAKALPLEGAGIGHVGIVVRDVVAASEQFRETFGVTIPAPTDFGPLRFPTDVPGSENSKVKLVMFKLAGLTIELIQPIQGPGPHDDFLKKYGPGLHHIAFTGLGDNLASIHALEKRGGKRTQVNYVDMKDVLGFTAEIGTSRDKW